ncbi:M23 family metallopeptidase [Lysinibacillus piscis]|uniref:M23ase beta-sheet core domain-containing protein n=1 Tax=Lysinibacillus piscis TaxID=2518931 RepID=A0ABQ5NJG9_9BACI|nr:M23 family metallopeptidase [Lysinibacillus sp. KH24]GLC88433.1 hypothetical protein LYSBPC_15600 [Lysinibacillus sp. KH24]
MFTKWKWLAAFFVVAIVMLLVRLEDQDVLDTSVRQVVMTSADLTYLAELGQEWFHQKETTIMVSSDISQAELLTFTDAQAWREGFLLKYDVGLPIYAGQGGLIVYTGHTKYTGKTMTISYDDGTMVSYGKLDRIEQLPYTRIYQRDLIGMKEAGQLYISIEKDGVHYTLEQIVQWLESANIHEN